MNLIEQHWYRPRGWLTALLAPLEGLFALLAAGRRQAFRRGWKKRETLPVPVVVIGNINVGGVGKTPLTLALLADFAARGVKAGVISRGYGGSAGQPTEALPDSDPELVGDEPLLLAAAGAPVVVGRDRVAAGRRLLALHPDIQLILSDDGLQHYRLARDLEIVVLDGRRGVGNGHLLPNGPLREPLSRLRTVDAVVVNGAGASLALPAGLPRFDMTLRAGAFHGLGDASRTRTAADFAGLRVAALAGIGHPQRFFHTLAGQGIAVASELSFPDHHAFSAADIPAAADAVIVTSKDAVKLARVLHDAAQRARLWVLPVQATLAPELGDWILTRLKMEHGR
ncbi:tetraacyldisaccharide 4'-kinase [Chromobacterium sphagni]|uniref:Tetraacyldisaccharide 4'-kinase n=1 Tax=Chromobacterium sphagni TaxID=1903179 RepID=A0A1S1X1K7_9NEIS|nr:tetraacyldisaccharide 4'-kinase [Chromobacterium sphagni]OHX13275.1 tetraacyldisaccharide 4'-kinase [Chromobacterium sphagni]OHX16985.1 tetraacyldisaccharide 4'-kinase [Chromobacterium sphagni]